VYPALAVLEAMRAKSPEGDQVDREPEALLWVGSIGGMEAELVARAAVPYTEIPAAGVHGVGWRNLPANLAQLGRGFLAGREVLRQFKPDVMLFTGGYVAVPMALAGRMPPREVRRPLSMLYIPDIEPGLALKTLARFADHIAVTAEASGFYFPARKPLTVTGYPTRPNLGRKSKAEARQELGLHPDLPVLLVFGGSKGARSINQALLEALPELLTEVQVVHISGRLDWPQVQARRAALENVLSPEMTRRYKAFPYLHGETMGMALASADLALSRAGAATLGEFPVFGLPAILVPYPHAWRYQMVNAQYLARQGAAVVIEDAALPEQILPQVRGLTRNPQKLADMAAAMRGLAQPDAARKIGALLTDLAVRQRGAA